MGDKMFDECAAIAKRLLETRTEIRRESGRAYAVEVDRVTGLTAEETREKNVPFEKWRCHIH